MAIFNSYVSLPEGKCFNIGPHNAAEASPYYPYWFHTGVLVVHPKWLVNGIIYDWGYHIDDPVEHQHRWWMIMHAPLKIFQNIFTVEYVQDLDAYLTAKQERLAWSMSDLCIISPFCCQKCHGMSIDVGDIRRRWMLFMAAIQWL